MNAVEDLWQKIEKQQLNFNQESTIESTVLIVGEPGCGKSSLIQLFLRPTVTKEPKSTIALEYNYAKKKTASATNPNQNTTSLCHIWELGGEVNESKLLEVPLSKSTLQMSAIMIICDLSQPQNILATMQKWIKVSRELVKKLIAEFRIANNNIKFVSKISQQAGTLQAYLEHTKDANRARPCEIPVYIVLNKYDLFKAMPAQDKRAIYQVARMFAHYHGAHIITTSVVEATLKDSFRSYMNGICFPTPVAAPIPVVPAASSEAKQDAAATVKGSKTFYDVNIEKPVQISASRDDFETVLLMSLSSASGTGKSSAPNTVDDSRSVKSRLLTAESDIAGFLTAQGVAADCWNKYSEHLKKLFGSAEVPAIKSTDDSGAMVSGLDATKKLPSSKSGGPDTAGENEFPEASIDEMRAQMELVLSRYIADAERKEQMRAKMTESDAETLLSENRAAGDGDRNRKGNVTNNSEMDDDDGKKDDRDPSPTRAKASSSGGSKVKKSTHK